MPWSVSAAALCPQPAVMLTKDRAGAGTAVAFQDPLESKEALHAVWNWEPGQFCLCGCVTVLPSAAQSPTACAGEAFLA